VVRKSGYGGFYGSLFFLVSGYHTDFNYSMAFRKESLQIQLKKQSPANIMEKIKFPGFHYYGATSFSENAIFCQQNLFHWIENYLKNILRDGCNSSCLNEWGDIETDSFGSMKTVDIILPTSTPDDENNINQNKSKLTEEQTKLITDKLDELKASGHLTDGKQLWFHGTATTAMENILANGIHLTEGSKKQDFSDGKGFYLSREIDYIGMWALKTAEKYSKNKGSIFVFELDVNEDNNTEGLFLDGKKDLWTKIIKYNRATNKWKTEKKKISMKVEEALENKQFIHGLVCDGKIQEDITPIPFEDFNQLCIIKKGKFLKAVEKNLKAVITVSPS